MPDRPVVLVTGCTQGGIGYALCQRFQAGGCCVYATARRPETMAGLQEQGIHTLHLDVTDSAEIKSVMDHIQQESGRLDIVVNNAGVVAMGPTAEVPLTSVQQCFAANVFGLLDVCQQAVPLMAAQGSGKIINIGSLTAFSPVPLRGIYSATKAAVQRLTDALRIELRPLGIQVVLVAPGFIDTNIREAAKASRSTASSLWGNWGAALDAATAGRLRAAVPVDQYAQQLVDMALQPKLPRYWIGQCAGTEWLARFLPLWLADWMLYRAMGLAATEPVLLSNAAALAQAGPAATASVKKGR